MPQAFILFLLLFAFERHVIVLASPKPVNLRQAPIQPPKPTQPPSKNGTRKSEYDLMRRQVTSIGTSTCGYYDGDPERSRTADNGYGCRLDVNNGLWGFCPTTVLYASDCGLAGRCIDSHSCKFGCGKTGVAGLTTFTCSDTKSYCSTVLLEGDFEGAFSYIACGARAVTETLRQKPTIAAVPSVTITPDPSTSSPDTATKPTIESIPSSTQSISVVSSTGGSILSTQSSPLASEATSSSGNKDEKKSSDGPNTTGIIIGGVIGGIALVCVTVLTAVYLLRRNRGGKDDKRRTSRFFSLNKSSQKPPTYDQSETAQEDPQIHYSTENNKTYSGWGPAEVYGSEVWRNPNAPVELSGAPTHPAELSARRFG